MLQQPALALEPAAILDQRAAGADQAMTGHDDAERIGAIGMADRARRPGHAELGRQRAIAHGGAGRNFWQRVPGLALERRAANAPFDRLEAIEVALEIIRQRQPDFGCRPRILQRHGAMLQPQQLPHARLILFPNERTEYTPRVGYPPAPAH